MSSDETSSRAAWSVGRIISIIAGVIIALLALRFIFVLLGANQGNAIVDAVYNLSRPFVEPFFGLFNYTTQFGKAHIEVETLVAIVVYALIAWILVMIFSIGADSRRSG
mgnify:CR=1 FL=1